MRSRSTTPTPRMRRSLRPSMMRRGAGLLPSLVPLQPRWRWCRRPQWPRRRCAATSAAVSAALWLGESPTGEDAAVLECRDRLVDVVPACRWLVLRSQDDGRAPLQARR